MLLSQGWDGYNCDHETEFYKQYNAMYEVLKLLCPTEAALGSANEVLCGLKQEFNKLEYPDDDIAELKEFTLHFERDELRRLEVALRYVKQRSSLVELTTFADELKNHVSALLLYGDKDE